MNTRSDGGGGHPRFRLLSGVGITPLPADAAETLAMALDLLDQRVKLLARKLGL